MLVLVLLLATAAGAAGAVVAHSAHERKPAYPLQYAPPDGIGPAEGMYVVTERIDDQAFVASLLWAAQQGAVDLTRTATPGRSPTRVGRGGPGSTR